MIPGITGEDMTEESITMGEHIIMFLTIPVTIVITMKKNEGKINTMLTEVNHGYWEEIIKLARLPFKKRNPADLAGFRSFKYILRSLTCFELFVLLHAANQLTYRFYHTPLLHA